jgi:hypothetical protein
VWQGRGGRYTSGVDLPDGDSLRAIVTTYAHLRAAHGEAIGESVLLQPTGDFFPDAFAPDPQGVARLLARMMTYAPLAADLPLEIAFVEGGESRGQGGGCGSAACGSRGGADVRAGLVADLGDRYRVSVAVADVAHPVLLATSLTRAIGELVLLEAGEVTEVVDAVASEIAAAMCGFGVLLSAGSAVWAKACGGLTVARATVLSVEEAAVVLALFVAMHGASESDARRHLETTQREALDHAWAWVESNPLLVETLRDRPALLESGTFDIEPVRGLLGRWLHKRGLEKALRAPLAPRAPISEAKRRRLEEARALVEEAFDGDSVLP